MLEPGVLESKTPLISGAISQKKIFAWILAPKCLAVPMRPLAKLRKMMGVILSYSLNKWTKMGTLFGTVHCAIILIDEYVIRTLPAKLKLLLISVLILM